MPDMVQEKLRALLRENGLQVLKNQAQFESLLQGPLRDQRLQLSLLLSALREGVPESLQTASGGTSNDALMTRLTRALQDNQGLSPDNARWAVESWAFALGDNGSHGAAPVATRPESPAQSSSLEDDEALKIFVGQNYDYFKRKWAAAAQSQASMSWNWAAFFLGFAWMAYRKMYLYSWIFIGAVVFETLCEYAFAFPPELSNGINLAIAATFGWQGNNWYRIHATNKVRQIAATNTPEQAAIELARQGGTNVGGAIGFLVAFAIAIFMAAAARVG